MYKVVLMQK